ncbi:MAG TPA: hypothetical protein DIU39_04545 [Flavobacteriales bacterium]|nr:hypothetical protein [Flavobacteriales bacterium]
MDVSNFNTRDINN